MPESTNGWKIEWDFATGTGFDDYLEYCKWVKSQMYGTFKVDMNENKPNGEDDMSRKPGYEYHMEFGKYNGQPISDVDSGYLVYCLDTIPARQYTGLHENCRRELLDRTDYEALIWQRKNPQYASAEKMRRERENPTPKPEPNKWRTWSQGGYGTDEEWQAGRASSWQGQAGPEPAQARPNPTVDPQEAEMARLKAQLNQARSERDAEKARAYQAEQRAARAEMNGIFGNRDRGLSGKDAREAGKVDKVLARELVSAGRKALARKYHPDLNAGSDEKVKLSNSAADWLESIVENNLRG